MLKELNIDVKNYNSKEELHAFIHTPINFLDNLTKDYEQDAITLCFGVIPDIHVLICPDIIKEVLVTQNKKFEKAKTLKTSKLLVGEGLLTSEGEYHKRQRILAQPAFKRSHISSYANSMVNQCQKILDRWQHGETRMINLEMLEVTLSIITKTMFNEEIDADFGDIAHNIDLGLKKINELALISKLEDIKNDPEFVQAKQNLDKIIYPIIEQKRENFINNGDLLSMLMDAKVEGTDKGMSNEQIRDELMTIFIAGHETTANLLTWSLLLIAQHPEVEGKFHNEINNVLSNKKPTIVDFENLVYTQNILWETLRFYPSVWRVAREAVEDVNINGLTIKKGEMVIISQYLSHRNPHFFESPEQFSPERFENGGLRSLVPYSFFPFGGGPRVCIGNHFAMLEATLVLAMIGQRFKLKLHNSVQKIQMDADLSLKPKGGLKMVLEKR